MSDNIKSVFALKVLPEHYDHLAPDTSEIRLLSQVEGGGLAHCTLAAGKVSIAVRHKTIEEIWYFVSGQGQVWRSLNGVAQVDEVYPGVSLTIPQGTSFQFRNTGEGNLCFIIATIPRWPGSEEAVPVQGYW